MIKMLYPLLFGPGREQVVSTAVNITSCWKIESLMTSQSLKIVQQLDTTLFTSASESVIHSLLLISGDVEQNPGPGRYPSMTILLHILLHET